MKIEISLADAIKKINNSPNIYETNEENYLKENVGYSYLINQNTIVMPTESGVVINYAPSNQKDFDICFQQFLKRYWYAKDRKKLIIEKIPILPLGLNKNSDDFPKIEIAKYKALNREDEGWYECPAFLRWEHIQFWVSYFSYDNKVYVERNPWKFIEIVQPMIISDIKNICMLKNEGWLEHIIVTDKKSLKTYKYYDNL